MVENNEIEKEIEELNNSIEAWTKYIPSEVNDLKPSDVEEIVKIAEQEPMEAVVRISETHKKIFPEEISSLVEVSEWVDNHPEWVDLGGNCHIVFGKMGVYIALSESEYFKEGIYFKDGFWKNGVLSKMDNTVDILVFLHIFSKVLNRIEISSNV